MFGEEPLPVTPPICPSKLLAEQEEDKLAEESQATIPSLTIWMGLSVSMPCTTGNTSEGASWMVAEAASLPPLPIAEFEDSPRLAAIAATTEAAVEVEASAGMDEDDTLEFGLMR